VEIGQKPTRRLLRRRREQPDVEKFVRMRIDSAVQPIFLTVDADHLLVNRNLIRSHRRGGL
jgi:hypothetical protein